MCWVPQADTCDRYDCIVDKRLILVRDLGQYYHYLNQFNNPGLNITQCYNSVSDVIILENIRYDISFLSLFPRCQRANFRLDELQCLILSLFKHNFVRAILNRGETECKRLSAKIT